VDGGTSSTSKELRHRCFSVPHVRRYVGERHDGCGRFREQHRLDAPPEKVNITEPGDIYAWLRLVAEFFATQAASNNGDLPIVFAAECTDEESVTQFDRAQGKYQERKSNEYNPRHLMSM